MADKVHGLDINGDQWELQDLPLTGQVALLQSEVEQLKRQINYSTTEQSTGRKWIDGKPIYQISKEITLANGADYNVENLEIDKLTDLTGTLTHTNGNAAIIPNYVSNTNYVQFYLDSNHRNIRCMLAGNHNIAPAVITIQYTKTTD